MFDLIVSLAAIGLFVWFFTPLRAMVVAVLTFIVRLIVRVARWGFGATPKPTLDFDNMGGVGATAPPHWQQLLDSPALFVYGTMGSGKTTLVKALIARCGGHVAIFNPKSDPDEWGCDTVMPVLHPGNLDEDWSGVIAALNRIRGELARRKHDKAARQTPLTVVLDDLPILAINANDAVLALLKSTLTIGRSLNVRVILVSQSNRAKMTGTSGFHDILQQLPQVKMVRRQGTLVYGGDTEQFDLDTSGVQRWANRVGSVDVLAFNTRTARTASERAEPSEPTVQNPQKPREKDVCEREREREREPGSEFDDQIRQAIDMVKSGQARGKADALKRVLGVTKGGSQHWQRASRRYNEMMGRTRH